MDNAIEHVKWWFNMGGYRPGSFTMSLIETIVRADKQNRAKLRQVYPEYVDAVEEIQYGKSND